MAKTLQQLYGEVMASAELKKEYLAAANDGKLDEFLSSHGCDATPEQLGEFLKHPATLPQVELCDDELEAVAGGTCYHNGRPVITLYNSCDLWICSTCNVSKQTKECTYAYAGACPKCKISAFCDECKYYRYEDCLMLCYHPDRINN